MILGVFIYLLILLLGSQQTNICLYLCIYFFFIFNILERGTRGETRTAKSVTRAIILADVLIFPGLVILPLPGTFMRILLNIHWRRGLFSFIRVIKSLILKLRILVFKKSRVRLHVLYHLK